MASEDLQPAAPAANVITPKVNVIYADNPREMEDLKRAVARLCVDGDPVPEVRMRPGAVPLGSYSK